MRGSVDGPGSSAPIGRSCPAVFADDDLAQRFVAGLDEVVAPILQRPRLPGHLLRPSLAPLDFAQWLAVWVGAETDGSEPEERLRAAVAAAAYLHRVRGTRRGLAEAMRLAFGAGPGDHRERRRRLERAPPRPGSPASPAPDLHVHAAAARPDPGGHATAWTRSWPPPAPPTCRTRSR